jgi:hypothetical protein
MSSIWGSAIEFKATYGPLHKMLAEERLDKWPFGGPSRAPLYVDQYSGLDKPDAAYEIAVMDEGNYKVKTSASQEEPSREGSQGPRAESLQPGPNVTAAQVILDRKWARAIIDEWKFKISPNPDRFSAPIREPAKPYNWDCEDILREAKERLDRTLRAGRPSGAVTERGVRYNPILWNDDAVQDVLKPLWLALKKGRLRPGEEVAKYLSRAIGRQKKRLKRGDWLRRGDYLPIMVKLTDNIVYDQVSSLEYRLLARNEEEHQMLDLSEEGLNADEMADRSSISRRTVYRRLDAIKQNKPAHVAQNQPAGT